MTDIIVDGLALSVVRHGDAPAGATPVIYVHGATFPSALAVNWRFADGHSWADDLADAGHDPWSFDFAGYGGSARYTEMAVEAVPGPLGRSDLAVRQLAAVVDHVRSHTGAAKVVLLAHSWGGVVASRCAAEYPDGIEKLVLFAPIIRRETPDPPDGKALPGWMPMPLAAQIKRFREDVPAGEDELISDAMFAPGAPPIWQPTRSPRRARRPPSRSRSDRRPTAPRSGPDYCPMTRHGSPVRCRSFAVRGIACAPTRTWRGSRRRLPPARGSATRGSRAARI